MVLRSSLGALEGNVYLNMHWFDMDAAQQSGGLCNSGGRGQMAQPLEWGG